MERIEVKAALSTDDAGAITGIAWPFGSADMVGDVIEKGAFAKVIGALPMLFAHDQRDAVGVWEEAKESGVGLEVKGRLLIEDVSRAREVRALMKAGGIGGLSIGFVTKKAAPRRGGGRTITDLDLKEISIVPVPCHPGAVVTSLKGAEKPQMSTATAEETATNVKAADLVAADVEKKLAEIGDSMKGLGGLPARLDKIEARLSRPGFGGEKGEEASVELKAFNDYLAKGDRSLELKTLIVSSDPQGGYLAPPETSSEFIRDLVEYSPIRSIASVRTTGAPAVQYPKRLTGPNAKWRGELEPQAESTLTFGQVEIPIREVSTFVDISNQLLQDSGGSAEAEVRLALAEDFGVKEATAFVEGNGVLEPEGLLTASGIGESLNGHATNLSADALIALMYALPAVYRARGSWLMNGGTLAKLRTMKDGQGNYLWQPSYQAGQPEQILGRPVVEAPDMPDVASGAFPVMFGDFNAGYRIVDRLALSILVNPYLLATRGITRIHATRRVGAGVIQPKALRKLKMATS